MAVAKFGCRQRASKSRVHIANHYHDVRALLRKHGSNFSIIRPFERLATGSNPKMHVRFRKTQIGKELIGHQCIVVLTGMHEHMFDVRALFLSLWFTPLEL